MLETRTTTGLVPAHIGVITASRMVLNTVFRFTYPLTQFVILRTGVSDQAAAWLVTIQVLAGIISPLGGYLGDRWGYRRMMRWGMGLGALGAIIAATTLRFPLLLIAFAIFGVGNALYLPAMQAYVSTLTPLSQRGRVLGVVELSWSMAGIVGVPLMALLLQQTGGITTPFALLAGSLALMWTVVGILPPDHLHDQPRQAPPPLRYVLRQPVVLALLAFLLLVVCGSETLFIAQPGWVRERFGADPVAYARALTVFGFGELGGVLLATAFTDRLGVRRAPLIGYAVAAAIYLALPIVSQNWLLYLLCFACFGLAFEFAIVSSFSLISATFPPARGMVLAAGSMAVQAGRAAGSQLGIAILLWLGIVANGMAAGLLTLAGCALALLWVHPQERHETG